MQPIDNPVLHLMLLFRLNYGDLGAGKTPFESLDQGSFHNDTQYFHVRQNPDSHLDLIVALRRTFQYVCREDYAGNRQYPIVAANITTGSDGDAYIPGIVQLSLGKRKRHAGIFVIDDGRRQRLEEFVQEQIRCGKVYARSSRERSRSSKRARACLRGW